MGIAYRTDREKHIIYTVWDGVVTADEWHKHIRKLIADPDWPLTSRVFVDLKFVTDTSSIGETELEQAVAIFSTALTTLSNKRVAVIVSEAYWKAKRFGELISRFGPSLIIFNSVETACLYLGINTREALSAIQQLRLHRT